MYEKKKKKGNSCKENFQIEVRFSIQITVVVVWTPSEALVLSKTVQKKAQILVYLLLFHRQSLPFDKNTFEKKLQGLNKECKSK